MILAVKKGPVAAHSHKNEAAAPRTSGHGGTELVARQRGRPGNHGRPEKAGPLRPTRPGAGKRKRDDVTAIRGVVVA